MSDTILMTRHGQTADNAGGRILGHLDPPLTDVGIAQAQRLAAQLRDAHVEAIWCSPLQRARQTADIVAPALGLQATTLAGLVESDRGRWEGRAIADIAREAPEQFAAFVAADPAFAVPGGETLAGQRDRTAAALATVAAGPLPAVVVAHAGTIRAALALWGLAVPPESALSHGEVAVTLDVAARRG
jgi:broad specificity phosphatase PhoE